VDTEILGIVDGTIDESLGALDGLNEETSVCGTPNGNELGKIDGIAVDTSVTITV